MISYALYGKTSGIVNYNHPIKENYTRTKVFYLFLEIFSNNGNIKVYLYQIDICRKYKQDFRKRKELC